VMVDQSAEAGTAPAQLATAAPRMCVTAAHQTTVSSPNEEFEVDGRLEQQRWLTSQEAESQELADGEEISPEPPGMLSPPSAAWDAAAAAPEAEDAAEPSPAPQAEERADAPAQAAGTELAAGANNKGEGATWTPEARI